MNSKKTTVLIAPDKFKGSLTAMQVCRHIASGLNRFDNTIETLLHPLADGGEGSLQIMAQHLSLEKVTKEVENPVGRKVQASYYRSGQKAFVELAEASGLELLTQEERNPLRTSTTGTGQLIKDALYKGANEIFLFIGGSATNDAAMGIAHELGYRFLNKTGDVLAPTGENLIKVDKIDSSNILPVAKKAQFVILCDVDNPLFGPNGAAFVYAPQKGATEAAVHLLDKGLKNFAEVVQKQFGTKTDDIPGSGAAGGIGAGLTGLFNSRLESGFEAIMDITQLKEKIQKADIIISGEGKLDLQTLEGKVLKGVSNQAKIYRKPFVAFVGQNQLNRPESKTLGAQNIYAVLEKARDLDHAISSAGEILEELSYDFIKSYFTETKAASN
ncbi:MAG: glycerate kinase [Bacteroidetes bacterium]|nr:MAG: glycerate kinase [Bacteroidota bacterium]